MVSRAAALAALLAGAGCTYVKPFAYRPVGAKAAEPRAPVKLAVLPFEDATEAYVQKGGIFDPDHLWWNLAREGVPSALEPVTAPRWAQAFARELDASGRFRGVRYCVDNTEVLDEDLLVTGAVVRADVAGVFTNPNQYEFRAAATRRKDGRKVWERSVSRAVPGTKNEACGDFGLTCMVDHMHEELRMVLAGMFEEAGADLARTLAGRPADGAPAPGPRAAPGPDAGGEPVDDTIRKILEGK
jgi:hypothetical protein